MGGGGSGQECPESAEPPRTTRRTLTRCRRSRAGALPRGGTSTMLSYRHSAALEAGGRTGAKAWQRALAPKAKAAQPWKTWLEPGSGLERVGVGVGVGVGGRLG